MNILYTTEAVGGAGRAGHGRTSRGRLAALALFAFAASPAGAAAPFAQVDGSWSGADRIILTDGKSEGLKCRAYYTRKGGGAEIVVALGGSQRSLTVALVLQGVARSVPITGVYEALAAADLHPDWVAGISIGAITVMGPLIAGNAPKTRVDKLHPFWEGITAERGGTGASGRIPCTRATPHSGGSINSTQVSH
jgi:hypothetical protein